MHGLNLTGGFMLRNLQIYISLWNRYDVLEGKMWKIYWKLYWIYGCDFPVPNDDTPHQTAFTKTYKHFNCLKRNLLNNFFFKVRCLDKKKMLMYTHNALWPFFSKCVYFFFQSALPHFWDCSRNIFYNSI